MDKQGEDFYLLCYMKAEDIARAYEVFNNSKLAIDVYYKENWEKYCEGRVVLEELLDLNRFQNSPL